MIETLKKVCEMFTKEPLSAQEVASMLGSGADDSQRLMRVNPFDVSFQKIEVARKSGSDAPSYVTLEPAASKVFTIGQLRAAYGDFNDLPRGNHNSAHRVMFRPKAAKPAKGEKAEKAGFSCAILADVEPDEAITDQTRVTSLTLRRDQPAAE